MNKFIYKYTFFYMIFKFSGDFMNYNIYVVHIDFSFILNHV